MISAPPEPAIEPKFAEPEIPAEALPEAETGPVGDPPHAWPEPVEPIEAASSIEEPEESAEAEAETEVEAVDEGVEPARIPTSLTAALREHRARYPHRVSRRSRRKMRGPGDGRPEGQSPAAR